MRTLSEGDAVHFAREAEKAAAFFAALRVTNQDLEGVPMPFAFNQIADIFRDQVAELREKRERAAPILSAFDNAKPQTVRTGNAAPKRVWTPAQRAKMSAIAKANWRKRKAKPAKKGR